MAVLALRTESPWSRFVLAFPWWAFASARNFLASSMSCRVSGLTLPASAFLMVSSACLITTGQLYAKDAEPTRTSAAQRIAATTNLMHRHSSLLRRSLSRVEQRVRARGDRRDREDLVDLRDQPDLLLAGQAGDRRLHLGVGARDVHFHQRPLLGDRRRGDQKPAAAGLGGDVHGQAEDGDGRRRRRKHGL